MDGNMLQAARDNEFFWASDITILSTYSCNLQCLGCEINSNYSIRDPFTKQDRLSWLDTLASFSQRTNIKISRMNVMGGEPFLDDAFLDIVDKIRTLFPDTNLEIYTNGLLMERRMDWLERLAKHERISFYITIHKPDESINKILSKPILFLKKNHIPVAVRGINMKGLSSQEDRNFWRMPYRFEEAGMKIAPFDHGDPLMSWTTCAVKYQMHLIDNKLYKCTRLAYLRDALAKTKQLDDPRWQRYLDYEPLDLTTAGIRETGAFAAKTVEKYCEMCDANNNWIPNDKPVYRKDYAEWFSANGTIESL